MNVNFEYYKVFYRVCAHGSLTAAARELCTSQPAAGQAVRRLEKEAGAKLFFRTSKGMQLTRKGELLYHYVKSGAKELLGGGKILKRMLNVDIGEVRIRTSDMTLQSYLLPYLEQFHREYPKIKVSVTSASVPETIKSLEEGRVGFGVVTSPFTNRKTVRQFQVKAICNVFITGSSFQESGGRELEYRELGALPCMMLEKNISTRTLMDVLLAQQGTLLKPEFELVISNMIMQFVRRNMGIGCIMGGFAENVIMRGEVFQLKLKHEIPLRHMCVVTGEPGLISMPGRRLLDMITCGQTMVEQLTGDRWQIMGFLWRKNISDAYGEHNKERLYLWYRL